MTMLGPTGAIALCLAALVLALRAGVEYGLATGLSLGAGAVSLVAMSLCLVLAARPRFLEPVFGGLDRMYQVHQWLGLAALATMLAHDLAEPEFGRRLRGSVTGEVGETLGTIAFYPLIALILFSWIKRIPYLGWEIPWHFWWFTHRLTGAFFAAAVLHALLVGAPIPSSDPLMVLLTVCGAVGIASYVFIEFVARRWRRRTYEVVSIAPDSGATALRLRPQGRPMRWRPGQFAFLSVPGFGFSEAHPFTIVGRPEADGNVRFAVKPLGDWTRRLPERVDAGAPVEIEGPYGRFDFREGGARQIWIAGGVGVTPFLAWLQSLSKDEDRTVHLFYSVRTVDEAIGLDVLRDAADYFPRFSYDVIVTQREGRLDADRVLARAPFAAEGTDFFFCGPTALRRAILKGLEARGVRPRRVRFELFEFR